MKLLTLDLELNQNPKKKIIELGYVITDTIQRNVLLKRSILVNPGESILPEITHLTGITDTKVADAQKLPEAYEIFCKDVKDFKVAALFAQWGMGDTDALRSELGLSWEDFVCRRRVIDVKSVYQAYAAFGNAKTRKGLEGACKELGMEFEGVQHQAMYDALNTWYVLDKLVSKMVYYDSFENIIEKIK